MFLPKKGGDRLNTMSLQTLVNGVYGRYIAWADTDEVTIDNVVDVFDIGKRAHEKNKPVIEYLWNYYKGDQPVNYREKLVHPEIKNIVKENHAFEIVQFKNGQTNGEPIQYTSRRDDDAINEGVDEFNDRVMDAGKHDKDVKSGEWQSATGTSFEAVQDKHGGENPIRFVAPNPLTTFVVYSRYTEEALLAAQELKELDGTTYYLCFSENRQFTIKDGDLIGTQLHAFGGIPIVEKPNNHERISDIELVIDLLDAINNMQSNRMDGVEQFVQSWIKFVNCDIDVETFGKMRQEGALVVKSNNGSENKADVDVMTQELNQSESQVAKEDLWDNALTILAIPNKQGNTGGDTQGAVELRNGWDFSKTRAKLKDVVTKKADKQLAIIALNVLKVNGIDLGLTSRDFEVQINHSPTDNMVIKCQSLQYLLQCGIHPLIALRTVGLWGDVEKVFMLSKPYLDNLWKTLDQAEVDKQMEEARQLLDEYNNSTENEAETQTEESLEV